MFVGLWARKSSQSMRDPCTLGRVPAHARQSLVTCILQFNSTRSTFNKSLVLFSNFGTICFNRYHRSSAFVVLAAKIPP